MNQNNQNTVRAVCADCAANHEQLAYGIAHPDDWIKGGETDKVSVANPYDNAKDCDSGCCPLTPVLRITSIILKNDVSFTTNKEENLVELNGKIQPECLGQGGITWGVKDAPDDYMDSGTPDAPATGGGMSSFRISADKVPAASTGRALPLAYKVTAGFNYNGTPLYADKIVKQDEIDKCRQEYFDLSKTGQDLTAPQYFSRYVRSEFSIGVDGANDPDYVRYIDCYSYIPPSREAEAETLRSKVPFKIDVKSGYRSPRKNRLQVPAGVWNSAHQFGDAVDLVPKDFTSLTMQNRALRFKALWDNTICPKILETGAATPMAFCKNLGDPISYNVNGQYNESNMYGLANCLHLGK